LCGQDLWYIEDAEDVLIENISIYHKNFVVVDDLTKVEDGILKMSIFDRVGAQENSYLHYKSFEERLKIAAGGKVWLDITRTDANKGEAVRMLQEIVGISADETLVFGDFMNDYEMMQAATYSYAMKNAYPKILEVARFVTEKDNNEGGVVDVIEKLCLVD
jgi:hydroxymethylpyrimidine pyrophosphatase-like HAD family hydrolase